MQKYTQTHRQHTEAYLERTVLISISSDDTEFLLEEVADDRRVFPMLVVS